MPALRFRSRSFRRVFVRRTSGKSVIHYKKRKPKSAHCSNCGSVLKGVPRERPYKMRKISKTKKRPERPYGGVLCSKCTKELIRAKVRGKNV